MSEVFTRETECRSGSFSCISSSLRVRCEDVRDFKGGKSLWLLAADASEESARRPLLNRPETKAAEGPVSEDHRELPPSIGAGERSTFAQKSSHDRISHYCRVRVEIIRGEGSQQQSIRRNGWNSEHLFGQFAAISEECRLFSDAQWLPNALAKLQGQEGKIPNDSVVISTGATSGWIRHLSASAFVRQAGRRARGSRTRNIDRPQWESDRPRPT
jgi:hypothetical protein